jgi:hypothetical protein
MGDGYTVPARRAYIFFLFLEMTRINYTATMLLLPLLVASCPRRKRRNARSTTLPRLPSVRPHPSPPTDDSQPKPNQLDAHERACDRTPPLQCFLRRQSVAESNGDRRPAGELANCGGREEPENHGSTALSRLSLSCTVVVVWSTGRERPGT